MGVVRQALRLRGQRSGDRAAAGAAGEHHLLALRIGDVRRIEARQRHDHRVGIALDRGLVQLAHVDQQHLALGQAARHVLGRQIVHRRVSQHSASAMTQSARFGAILYGIARNRHARHRAIVAQIVTWVPTSTTRPVGIWK